MINRFKSHSYKIYNRLVKRNNIEKVEKEIIQFEALDAREKEKVRTEKLLTILNRAYLEVPYYRELFDKNNLKFSDSEALTGFAKIPILNKKIIRENFEKIKNKRIDEYRWLKGKTSGSTGNPLIFILDQDYLDIKLALGKYQAQVNGKTLDDTTIKLWGFYNDIEGSPSGIKHRMGNWLRNRVDLNSRNMTDERMAHFVEVLKSKKSVYIEAYAQSVYELSKYIIKHNIVIKNVTAVISTTSTLFDFMRVEIERAFNCPVYNRYGSRETSLVAFEKNQIDGLQVQTSQYIVEVLNEKGKHCNPGEEGEVVITNFSNFAFPFIRYNLEDRAVAKLVENIPVKSCVSFEKVTGRVADMFIKEDGSLVDSQYFAHVIGQAFNSGWVEKMQIVQLGFKHIQINIVKTDNTLEPENDVQLMRNGIIKVMGEDCRVDFNFMDQIDATQSGKYQFVKSLLSKENINLNSGDV